MDIESLAPSVPGSHQPFNAGSGQNHQASTPVFALGTEQLLDPRNVHPSRWANRSSGSFSGPDFENLKLAIAHAGGNSIAAIVRRTFADEPLGAVNQCQFELACGHRRHRACLELGLPLNVVVKELTDLELTQIMHDENHARQALSPLGLGMMVDQWLNDGLHLSQRRVALSIGRHVSDISRSLVLARLPRECLDALTDPHQLQFRDGEVLRAVWDARPIESSELIKKLSEGGQQVSRFVLMRAFRALGVGSANTQEQKHPLHALGILCGSIKVDKRGLTTITLRQQLSPGELDELSQLIEKLCEKSMLRTDAQRPASRPRFRP
jgi:ParB family chromosome partitioning protein